MKIFKTVLIVCLSLILLWAVGLVAFTMNVVTMSPQNEDETTDAIVVLTGGSERVEEGLKLFATGRASHLFISGVHEDVKKSEITGLWKGNTAMPPCCVTLGYEATTTEQNALETRKWLEEQDYQSIRLVTGNYHMPRAYNELAHALPGIDIYANPMKQPDLDYFSTRFGKLVFIEYHKWLYRKVTLLITPQEPLQQAET